MKRIFIAAILLLTLPNTASAAEYFISPNGSDNNPGSQSQPFQTFQKALEAVTAGDTIFIRGGTYNETVTISKSGTSSNPIYIKAYQNEQPVVDANGAYDRPFTITGNYIYLEGIEATNTEDECVYVSGDNVTIKDFIIHECFDHGLYTEARNTVFEGNTVYRAALNNQNRNLGSGFPSGIKVRVGGENTLLKNNTTYNNYGEGIAVTRGVNAQIIGNTAYDNYSVNIYVDNSIDVLVEENLAYCTGDPGFTRDGHDANAYSIGEEYYSGWGAQLKNLTFRNNIASSCYKGITYWGADVSGGGLDNVKIFNNTFWNIDDTIISIAYESAKTRNVEVRNNIFHNPTGKTAWIENPAGMTFSNNYWSPELPADWTNAEGTNDKNGGNPFVSTPTYTDITSFTPKSGSAIIDAGYTVSSFSTDFFGNQRSGAYDIGAIEFGSTPSSTSEPTPEPSPNPTPSPDTSTCTGDLDSDNDVDLFDFLIFSRQYGTYAVEVDFNGDGNLNVLDFLVFAKNYGITC